MPTTGAPGNIWYPDATSPVAPLENLFLTQATSVNVAFDIVNTELDRREIQTFRRTTLALLSAIAGLVVGDRGFVSGVTGNGEYMWSGTAWVPEMVIDSNGAIPVASTPIIKTGVVSVVFSGGAGTLTFPTPFPTECVSLVVIGQRGVGFPMNLLSAPTRTNCAVANTGGISGTFPVHFVAFGY